MQTTHCAFLALLMLFMHAPEAQAELSVVIDHNGGNAATEEFKFKQVPTPSRSDAGNGAVFTVIAGRRDGNGAEVESLNDGKLPSNADDPSANFFFAAGTPGGRLLVDLGKATAIKRVATYSWHPGPRGRQVYKLYGAVSKADDFNPADTGKLESLGDDAWKLLAEVDARPEDGEPGGQYGVNISNKNGELLGEYRYLLFQISRTGAHRLFDNTFFSEIDVDDGKEHPLRETPIERVVEVLKVGDQYEIAFDTTEAPELKPWVDEKLKPICGQWYPRIVQMLPSDDYQAPTRFVIVFEKDMRGVAYTAGRRVVCAAPWFKANLDGEAAGAVVHELVHVVQQYGRARTGNRSPGWMVEGLADYIRWFLFEPEELRPRPNPDRAHYTDSYRTTGAFLNFVVNEYDADCIRKFNGAMREGAYRDELWQQYTGKTADELWEEYVKTLNR